MATKGVHRPLSPPPTTPTSGGSAVPVPTRRQPAILKEPAKLSARFAEMAGGTAAECAAICCCCPCGLVNLLILVTVRLPAGLCRRALRHRMKRKGRGKKKAGLLVPKVTVTEDEDVGKHRSVVALTAAREAWPAASPSPEVTAMEKEMWAKFYGTGFWRSPSQREER